MALIASLDPGGARGAEEELLTSLAARQHGLVTRAQLLNAGLSPGRLDRRVAVGRLRPVQRGIYQVGPLAFSRAKEMAAVLACGAGAHVSHRSAAAMWELLPRDVDAPVHVTVGGRGRCHRPGVVVHRVAALDPSEVTQIDGVPVTAPARTLFDLANGVRGRELEQAMARAERKRLTNRSELLSLVSRHSRRRGIRALRHLLQDGAEPVLARSEAEERFLALIRRARLPAPEANSRIGNYEVDFVWRAQRVVVEVDGFAFHASRTQFRERPPPGCRPFGYGVSGDTLDVAAGGPRVGGPAGPFGAIAGRLRNAMTRPLC